MEGVVGLRVGTDNCRLIADADRLPTPMKKGVEFAKEATGSVLIPMKDGAKVVKEAIRMCRWSRADERFHRSRSRHQNR